MIRPDVHSRRQTPRRDGDGKPIGSVSRALSGAVADSEESGITKPHQPSLSWGIAA